VGEGGPLESKDLDLVAVEEPDCQQGPVGGKGDADGELAHLRTKGAFGPDVGGPTPLAPQPLEVVEQTVQGGGGEERSPSVEGEPAGDLLVMLVLRRQLVVARPEESDPAPVQGRGKPLAVGGVGEFVDTGLLPFQAFEQPAR